MEHGATTVHMTHESTHERETKHNQNTIYIYHIWNHYKKYTPCKAILCLFLYSLMLNRHVALCVIVCMGDHSIYICIYTYEPAPILYIYMYVYIV